MPAKWSEEKWARKAEVPPEPKPAQKAEPELSWRAEYTNGHVYYFKAPYLHGASKARLFGGKHGYQIKEVVLI
jgi:hypothetical protein